MTAQARKLKPLADTSPGGKLFAALVAFYAATDPHVDRATLFGFDCLRAGGKVFAKLHNGNLVVKLPAQRIASLMDLGRLRPYDRGRAGSMKEWAVVAAIDKRGIIALAEEARAFAGGR